MFGWLPGQVYLVDVAYWQSAEFWGRHVCDWQAAWEHGCVGAYVKRSQGCKTMSSGRGHVERIADSPVARGDYHFVDCRQRKDLLHPGLQAEVFATEVGELQPYDLAPAIDYEGLSGTSEYPGLDWLLSFAAAVEGHLGVRPRLLYTQWWLKGYLPADVGESFDLWLAAGGGDPRVEIDKHTVPTVERLESRWTRGKYARRSPVPGHWPEATLYQHVGHAPWYRDGGNIDRNVPAHWLATVRRLQVGG